MDSLRHTVFACVFLCGVFPVWAWGQEAATERPSPESKAEGKMEDAPELLLWQDIPTVISASRREEPASRAPNAVSIITAEQIHESGLMTLGDLLRLAVGVDVAQIDGGTHAIGVRGLHGKWANSTLVLMDGRTLYNPVWGGMEWQSQPIFLEDIERIEVVRGPGGAAWGANAANGVINIITKKPGDTPGGFLSQTVTSRLDSLTYLRYGLTAGKLDLRLSAGYDSMPEIGVRHGPGNHDFVRMARGSLRSTYHFDKERSLDLDAGYVDGVHGAIMESVQQTGGVFDDAAWYPQSHFLRMRYTHQRAPDDSWHIGYYLNRATLDESNGGMWMRYTQHDVEAQRVQRVGDRHVLTYGGNVRADYLTNGDPPAGPGFHGSRADNRRTHNNQLGVFVQDRFELNDQWTTVLGVRADRNSYTDWEWAGRGTVLYHPVPGHTFRASIARAFRTPTLADRTAINQTIPTGLPPPFPAYAAYTRGNEDIHAAYIKAYEFGYTWERKNLRLNGEFFWNNYRGSVVGCPLTAPAFPLNLLFQNEIDGDLYGVELSGQWQATQRLRLDGAYVWERWEKDGRTTWFHPDWPGIDLAIPPRNKVTVGARYEPAKDLFLTGRMWWVDEIRDNFGERPPYARFDFNVAKRLGDHSEVAVGVLNAFDSRHPEAATGGHNIVEVGERTWYVRFQTNF